ncbi:iron-containing redox enzyme family protein [Kitasatospora sp. NPDC101801]|uniref:iron-containing redox enzyme family protein n=1 Tax=Kitasatospora sp. NPDC101801 TaxID=3364103 RepID=UPI003828164C
MTPTHRGPELPTARGPLSRAVITLLRTDPAEDHEAALRPVPAEQDCWSEDHQLALYLCYELHYRGFAAVDADWEWHPAQLRLRRALERPFLAELRARTGDRPSLHELLEQLLVEPVDGSGPSYFLLEEGMRRQAQEYLMHRSLYHLKEADPQAWVIPRLVGAAQAAYVAVEFDEYGAGRAERAHSLLFAEMMADFGLEPTYGHYAEVAAAPALAVVNLMSLFGLHRALRGAAVGQFATVEITSSPGSARLAKAFERLGAGPAGTLFYREHVEADAVHEQLVRHGVIRELLLSEPELEDDIAFGIAATGLVEDRFAAHLLEHWRRGDSSLRSVASGGAG